MVDVSSVSSTSKLRLQDLSNTNRKTAAKCEKEVKNVVDAQVNRRNSAHSLLLQDSDVYLMIWRMLLTVASFSGTCRPSGPNRGMKLCWPP